MSQRPKLSLRDLFHYILPILTTGFAYGWENGSLGGILAMPREFPHESDAPSPLINMIRIP